MGIIEILDKVDTSALLWINGFHNSFFDGFMFALSNRLTWIPLYISLLYLIIRTKRSASLWIVGALILCVVLSDHIASGLIKNLVQRPRPSHAVSLEGIVHLVHNYRSGMYGFVSSHAANTFGLALLSSLIIRKRAFSWVIFSWSVLNMYSRMYLGVHYPFDILGGMLVGISVAMLIFMLLRKWLPEKINFSAETNSLTSFERNLPGIVFSLTLAGSVIYSIFIF